MIPGSKFLAVGTVVLAVGTTVCAENAKPGMNEVMIRGQRQKVYFYPANGKEEHRKILFAPGDGGCRGFAITIGTREGRLRRVLH